MRKMGMGGHETEKAGGGTGNKGEREKKMMNN